MSYNSTELVVIGGGAAGMMCAYTAADRGVKTILLEPNRQLGRKLRITGKGRCNVTNNCDIKTFMSNIPGDGRFLYSALNRLSPEDTIAFFESHGLPLKTERGNRVFPQSDNANDVAALMTKLCRNAGVKLMQAHATGIAAEDGCVSGVSTDQGFIPCRAAAVCTGGLSYPLTGSTGDGFGFARRFGHTVTPARASLVPLESGDDYCAEMQGFSLKNVTLSAYENDKLIYRELGEMLFTHFGVSGPLILSASAHMRHFDKKQYRLEIDLKPALDEQMLDKRLLSDFEKHANSDYCNVLGALLPQKMIDEFIDRSGIPPHEKVHDITRAQRETIRTLLKRWTVNVSAPMPVENAIITSGGVKVGEIDPKTMASKKIGGLYFAGEIIDVDAYTGGYNLQIAWATGKAAGEAAADALLTQ